MKHIVPHLVLEEDPAVKTQTTIRLTDGRHAFLDMEITASTPEPTNVWVEVKRTGGESGSDQFEKYQQTLAENKGQRVMLILAPSHMRTHLGQLPPAHEWRPDSDVCPHWISWEDVYEALAALPASTDSWEAWARGDLLKYLEMEGLQPVPVTHAHVDALANIAEAAKALALLATSVEERLAPRIGEPTQRTDPGRDYYYYYERRYPAGRIDPRSTWSADAGLAWGFDGPEIFAGAWTPGDRGPVEGMSPEAIESWRASFGDGAWKRLPGAECWVWKVLPLSRLADIDGIEQQAERVTAFVGDTLSDVVAAQPV